jgi:beta-glucosidase
MWVGDLIAWGDRVMDRKFGLRAALLIACASAALARTAATSAQPASAATAEQRAANAVSRMTLDEKLQLVFGYFATDWQGKHPPAGVRYGSAGYVPGIPRLGITPQWETDAGVGVATQGGAQQKRERTALPSGLATAATWNPELAFKGGHMIGSEARASGFNVMLAGGVDLERDPRNGRNFEYGGEDPLLAGTIVGSEIAGIQSNHIISTTKHYALNDLETGRKGHDARIDPAAARMSDLLAFQFAIERGNPGSVMCAYNKVNGDFSCENDWLLNRVLKGDFDFRGYVMSDWGAVHSTVKAALNGLDQQSGWPFDEQPYFGAPLKAAVAAGQVPQARIDDMARRVLWALYSTGAQDNPVTEGAPIDFAANEAVSQADAEQAIVLLKNDGNLLPLGPNVRRIVVIGGHADKGVLAGSGSSLVYPRGGNAVAGLEPTGWPGPVMYYPSSPVEALRALAPNASITFVDGSNPAAAVAAARNADVTIVFGTQWSSESIDVPMKLDGNQDALIEAVAAANPRTAVVLETNAGVAMPWAARVPVILEAWYPGRAGGKAIANVLTGRVNPSGHLPVTFYASEAQLPRPARPGGNSEMDQFAIDYSEGAAVGYKWVDRNNIQPLFPFGHGLSYTSFAYGPISASPGANGSVRVHFRLRNTGQRRGMAVGQVYASPAAGTWEAPRRLVGFAKVDLAPGQSKAVDVDVDPRLLATFDEGGHAWRIAPGGYTLSLGASSRDLRTNTNVTLPGLNLPANWRPGRPIAGPAPTHGERG